MYLKNDDINPDQSNIIVTKIYDSILMHVREVSENGLLKDARIIMDRHLVTELIKFLTDNMPQNPTRKEQIEKWENKNEHY